jgi:hypothetical protein
MKFSGYKQDVQQVGCKEQFPGRRHPWKSLTLKKRVLVVVEAGFLLSAQATPA